ncbi:MAG: arylsulfatase [Mariniphaga sp.]|nr:arylsulfatase [Mariniphaga sp.]
MNRIFHLAIILILIGSCDKQEIKNQPNIILIVTDDQGWGDLSFNGNTNLHTPNIDKLAENGVSFDRFYVCPVCSPTRGEILTGRYHLRGGVYSTSAGGERLDLDETTIAEIFKQAGYSTAAYGKWHNGMQAPYHPNARGFDDFYGFCSGHWGNYFDPVLEHNGEIVKGNGFIIDDLTNRAIDFIGKNRNNPFFLYLPYNTPHSPMQVPERFWKKFEDKKLEMVYQGEQNENINFTKAALAMCENIDWNVGRITKAIDSQNLSENTIIIYMSDNGPNGWRWNGEMKGRKGSTDEGGVRSPLFIKWEGNIKPGTVQQISGAIDLLPTLTSLTTIDFNPEKELDGIDLSEHILKDNNKISNRLIFSHWGNRTSVRNQQFRLDNNDKLFDMQNDPGQTKDVSKLFIDIKEKMVLAKSNWENIVLSELPKIDTRSFPIGHPEFVFTQVPARDGQAHGNIQRSNRYPNCSFFTNWISTEDKITWDAEVLADGDFEVILYYTCSEQDIGSTFELSFGNEKLIAQITKANNPPLIGMENDRDPRIESYVKDFKPMKMGTIHLSKGKGELDLKATKITGSHVMDFRMLILKRVE